MRRCVHTLDESQWYLRVICRFLKLFGFLQQDLISSRKIVPRRTDDFGRENIGSDMSQPVDFVWLNVLRDGNMSEAEVIPLATLALKDMPSFPEDWPDLPVELESVPLPRWIFSFSVDPLPSVRMNSRSCMLCFLRLRFLQLENKNLTATFVPLQPQKTSNYSEILVGKDSI